MAGRNGGQKGGRSWKLERASVNKRTQNKPRSNKYRRNADGGEKPKSGQRTRAWVGGYTRADGRKVKGHYREIGQPSRGNRSANRRRAASAVILAPFVE